MSEMMAFAEQLGQEIGMVTACQVLGVSRTGLYRERPPAVQSEVPVKTEPKRSVRALSETERETVRQELNSERFQDQSPREIYATLIDEGRYLCSYRTMYRILEAHAEVRERRNQ